MFVLSFVVIKGILGRAKLGANRTIVARGNEMLGFHMISHCCLVAGHIFTIVTFISAR